MGHFLVLPHEQTDLVRTIAGRLTTHTLIAPCVDRFADGELRVSFPDPQRLAGGHAVVIQQTGTPVHTNTMLLAFTVQALRNAGIAHVSVVIPYLGYGRADKGSEAGTPGHVQLIGDLFKAAGVDDLHVVAIHAPALMAGFPVPLHTITLDDLLATHIRQTCIALESVCLVAPDGGAVERVRRIADILGVGYMVFTKERTGVDESQIIGSTGSCRGRTAIVIDDIISTGGTALNAHERLRVGGFESVYGYFIHPVFAIEDQVQMVCDSFDRVVVTNTVPLPYYLDEHQVVVLDVSDAIVEAIG